MEHWDLMEIEDRERARLQSRRLRYQANRARRVIAAALRAGPCYVSVSWGKDSIVALDLALSVRPDIRVVHIVQGSAVNPDDLLVRDEALSRWPLRYVEIPWPADEEYTYLCWEAQCRRAAKYGARITGIRAEESAIRRLSASHHGERTAKTCRPILRWPLADVYAWMALRDLPVHPVYAMTAGGVYDRKSLRVSSLMDLDQMWSDGSEFGRQEWERLYYGRVVERSYRRWAE